MKRKQVLTIVTGSLTTILLGVTLFAGYMNLKLKQKVEKVQTTTYHYDEDYLIELAHSSSPEARVVHNTGKGLWDRQSGHKIQLTKEWELGYDDNANLDINIHFVGDMHADSRDNLTIYDENAGKIYCFNPKGEFQFTVGQKGQGPGELAGNVKFVILHDSLLYTCDYDNQRISQFVISNNSGKYMTSYNLQMDGRPLAFVLNDSGETFLSFYDQKNNFCIHKYDKTGKHLTSFGKPIKLDLPNQFLLYMIERNSYYNRLDLNNNFLLSSQDNPYKIDLYLFTGRLMLQITRRSDFMKPPDMEIRGKETYTLRMPPGSSCIRMLDSLIINAIFFPNLTTPEVMTILDIFDLQGRLLTSFKIPERIFIAEVSRNRKVYGKLWGDREGGFLKIVKYAMILE